MKAIGMRAKSHVLPILRPCIASKTPASCRAPSALDLVSPQRRESSRPSSWFGHLAPLRSAPAAVDRDCYDERTLEDLPDYEFALRDDGLRLIPLSMIRSGYHRWGFLAEYKKNLHEELVRYRRAELLENYLDWVVVEGPKLDGATKTEVRRRFRRWVREETREAGLGPDSVSRFKYCLYVDQKCLDTLEPFQRAGENPYMQDIMGKYQRPPMVIVVVDRRWRPRRIHIKEKDRGHPPIEGCDEHYVGWAYMRSFITASLYHDFSGDYEKLEDRESYARPPLLTPYGALSMPE
ncbi:hypothetical protein CPLU01_04368 [Colletotrichum plurivorum]|uniref:Uncharacterized protein n=1 Tax=Colletotrichum plurivorum TaxID=2175906 RepID=A0A8H6KQ18_9PEZI|nr:hypothetical protein CPLU01_04368 [Colletotrichum plurivorum]